jgi:hypothetical protein
MFILNPDLESNQVIPTKISRSGNRILNTDTPFDKIESAKNLICLIISVLDL